MTLRFEKVKEAQYRHRKTTTIAEFFCKRIIFNPKYVTIFVRYDLMIIESTSIIITDDAKRFEIEE